MKKSPKHCAHVCAFYSAKADLYRRGTTLRDMLPSKFMDGSEVPGGAKSAIRFMEHALRFTRLAAREFVAAGGAA